MALGCACASGRRWPSFDTPPGVRLTVLVENRDGCGCTGAHGLAVWLQARDQAVLVDTGPDPALLARNAALLGCDLAQVVAVVLSHGHDDHSGGLPAVVAARAGRPLAVVMHPAAVRPRFSLRTGLPRAIGMPAASLAALAAPGVEVVAALQPTAVVPGVWATGAIPRLHPPRGEKHLTLDAVGRQADPLDDDQAVVVDTVHGLALVCGCAHAGLASTIAAVAAVRPGAALALVAGGLHLGCAGGDEVAEVAALLGQTPARVAVGHCTGAVAEAGLARLLPPGRVTVLACGTRLGLP
jgi:7,8-dihydropterin-6-yl-methyl-4-(beta-D-ribofuranosyl)aminobenzene 5'-phosphate synthase